MRNRRFSKRENVLLLILVVLLLAVFYNQVLLVPTQKAMLQAELDLSSLQSSIDLELMKAQRITSMQQQLEEIEDGTRFVAPVASFDNTNGVVDHLNSVLASSEQYSLIFYPTGTNKNETLVARPIHMVFTARSYDNARQIISELYAAPYRCMITSFSITAGGGAGQSSATLPNASVTVSLSVSFLEQVEK